LVKVRKKELSSVGVHLPLAQIYELVLSRKKFPIKLLTPKHLSNKKIHVDDSQEKY